MTIKRKHVYITLTVILITGILLFLLVHFFLNKPDIPAVLDSRGFNVIKTIKPLVVSSPYIGPLASINEENCVATINDHGEFCRLEIDDDGDVDLSRISGSFPPVRGSGLQSSPDGDILWIPHYTGCYMFDLESGRNAHISCINGEKVRFAVKIDQIEKIVAVMFSGGKDNRTGTRFVLYSLLKQVVLDEKYYEGIETIILFTPGSLLCSSFDRESLWFFTDRDFKETWRNGLTDWMSKELVDLPPMTRAVAGLRNLMIIPSRRDNSMQVVKWSDDGKDVKTQRLFSGTRWKANDRFVFSPDQKWFYSTVRVPGDTHDSERIVFFNVDTRHNNAISEPYLGGYTAGNARGAFFRHKLWGLCFIEQNPDYPGLLFIYKLEKELKQTS